MASNVSISSQLTERSSASIQFLVTLMASNKIEITTGKLRTAINMLLLFALAAMPESIVSEDANPNDVKSMVMENKKRSMTGLFKNRMKRIKPVNESSEQRRKL